jgi:TonB family protein
VIRADGITGTGKMPRMSGKLSPLFLAKGTEAPVSHAGLFSTSTLPSAAATPEVRGELDKGLIDKEIKRHLGKVKRCYSEARRRSPGAGGKVTVAFVIDRVGTVARAGIKASDLHDPLFDGCVVAIFAPMTFPAPGRGGVVHVSYPFLFDLR